MQFQKKAVFWNEFIKFSCKDQLDKNQRNQQTIIEFIRSYSMTLRKQISPNSTANYALKCGFPNTA